MLPYPNRSKISSSSHETEQDCLPYQMDSLIAAVSEAKEREKKYVRLENCNINLYHNKTHDSMKDQELSRSPFGLKQLSWILRNKRLAVVEWL